jgi:predicted NBD/HSP70 family sugar kinase
LTLKDGFGMNDGFFTGNTKIREEHKKEILRFVRKYGPLSRTKIFKKTNISKPTVSRIIDALLDDGIIMETGVGESSIGRRPVNIELNPSARSFVGVNISKNTVSASLVDLCMNVVANRSVSIKGLSEVGRFLNLVAGIIEELINGTQTAPGKVSGVGVGTPGLVDFEKGVIKDFAIAHSMVDVHLKEFLEDRLKIPVFVDNNANTRALGEYWYGYGTGYKDIIFVICSEGVGSGIISGGNLLRGQNNITAGFGHVSVDMDGRRCRCGGFGCIEAYCSTEVIEETARDLLKTGSALMLAEKLVSGMDSLDYKAVCKCAEEGDRQCMGILDEAAKAMGTGLANMVVIFNSEIIILSGSMFDESGYFFDQVLEITRQRLENSPAKNLLFRKRRVKDALYEVGAATLVLKEFFKD